MRLKIVRSKNRACGCESRLNIVKLVVYKVNTNSYSTTQHCQSVKNALTTRELNRDLQFTIGLVYTNWAI